MNGQIWKSCVSGEAVFLSSFYPSGVRYQGLEYLLTATTIETSEED